MSLVITPIERQRHDDSTTVYRACFAREFLVVRSAVRGGAVRRPPIERTTTRGESPTLGSHGSAPAGTTETENARPDLLDCQAGLREIGAGSLRTSCMIFMLLTMVGGRVTYAAKPFEP